MKYTFCCNTMDTEVNEDKSINYDYIFRRYSLDIDDKSVIEVLYCPWCGSKLPKELITELYETLKENIISKILTFGILRIYLPNSQPTNGGKSVGFEDLKVNQSIC
jgi:hypothetical protein